MVAGEPVDAALQHLLGAARGENHPQPGDRPLPQCLGHRDQDGDRAQVVVRARDHRAASDVGEQRGRQRAQRGPGGGQAAAPGRGSGGDHRRSAYRAPPLRDRGVDPLDHAREPVDELALCGLVEGDPGAGGVVVGHQHKGAIGAPGHRPRRPRSRSSCGPRSLAVPGAGRWTPRRRSSPPSAHRRRSRAPAAARRSTQGLRARRPRSSRRSGVRSRRGTPPRRPAPRAPARVRRPAIHSAASRSPSEPASRSSGASASTTSRRVSIDARVSTPSVSTALVRIGAAAYRRVAVRCVSASLPERPGRGEGAGRCLAVRGGGVWRRGRLCLAARVGVARALRDRRSSGRLAHFAQ